MRLVFKAVKGFCLFIAQVSTLAAFYAGEKDLKQNSALLFFCYGLIFFPPFIPALSEGHECYFSQTLEFITDDMIYTGDKISFTVIIAWVCRWLKSEELCVAIPVPGLSTDREVSSSKERH